MHHKHWWCDASGQALHKPIQCSVSEVKLHCGSVEARCLHDSKKWVEYLQCSWRGTRSLKELQEKLHCEQWQSSYISVKSLHNYSLWLFSKYGELHSAYWRTQILNASGCYGWRWMQVSDNFISSEFRVATLRDAGQLCRKHRRELSFLAADKACSMMCTDTSIASPLPTAQAAIWVDNIFLPSKGNWWRERLLDQFAFHACL